MVGQIFAEGHAKGGKEKKNGFITFFLTDTFLSTRELGIAVVA